MRVRMTKAPSSETKTAFHSQPGKGLSTKHADSSKTRFVLPPLARPCLKKSMVRMP